MLARFRVTLEADYTTMSFDEIYASTNQMLIDWKKQLFKYVESLDEKKACPFDKIVEIKELSEEN